MQQPGGRIHFQTGTHHQKHIGGEGFPDGIVHFRYSLTKPYNVRPQRTAVGGLILRRYFAASDILTNAAFGAAAGPAQFAMKVYDAAASCPFMQVIHILGNDGDTEMLFQPGQQQMSLIRLHFIELPPALVVKALHQFRISAKCFRGGHVFNPVTFPQSTRVAEGAKPAFGADAGSGEHNQVFFHQKFIPAPKRMPETIFPSVSFCRQAFTCPKMSPDKLKV